MRNMSFALTTDQIRNQTKTVTRRIGWKHAKAGDIVQPVVKCQGIPKGGRVEKIGPPIRFVAVDEVQLDDISFPPQEHDVAREGFPHMSGSEFVKFFCEKNGCPTHQRVTRIEFEYLP